MEENTNIPLLPLYAYVRTHMDTSTHKTEVEKNVIMTISPPPHTHPGAGKNEGTIKESKEGRDRAEQREATEVQYICLFRRGKPHSGFRTSPLIQKSNGKVPVSVAIASTNAQSSKDNLFSQNMK